jgi:hypothetical protein
MGALRPTWCVVLNPLARYLLALAGKHHSPSSRQRVAAAVVQVNVTSYY